MIIDKNGKLFSKISIIDLILIVLIVLAGIGVGFRVLNIGNVVTVKSDTTLYVTYKAEGVRQYSIDAVSVGDVFYEKNGPKLGTVSAVTHSPGIEIATKTDGTSQLSQSPDKYDLYITLECEGKESDTGFFINGTKQVAHGVEMKIRSMKLTCDSAIVEDVGY